MATASPDAPNNPIPSEATGGAVLSDHELLSALLETIPDHVYFKDARSRFVRINPSMARRFGLADPREAVGKSDFDFFTPEHANPAFDTEQRIILTGKPVVAVEERETWGNGDVSWVSTTKVPLRDANGVIVGTFGISRDITPQKVSEERRRLAEAKLLVANKMESIGRLAAGIAHEINTPSQFILSNLHFLDEAVAKLIQALQADRNVCTQAAKHPELAAAAAAAAQIERDVELDYLVEEIPRALRETTDGLGRVTRIVDSLKEVTHPGNLTKSLANLNRTVEVAIAVCRHEWKYVADVEKELDPSLPLVPCMVDQISQVILNLVVNASHAVADALKESGAVRGKIIVRTRKAGDWAIIEVTDTGAGIPVEIRGRIFEPFFTTKKQGHGTGQGLALVRTIVEANHGGQVNFDSEVGRGTTFRVQLPLTAPAGTS